MGIISIDPTLSFCARAPVLDHFTMADGDRSASEEVNLGARRRWFYVDDASHPAQESSTDMSSLRTVSLALRIKRARP